MVRDDPSFFLNRMRVRSAMTRSLGAVVAILLLTGCGDGGGGDVGSGDGGQCVTISGDGVNGESVSIVGPDNACDTAYSPPILIVSVGTQVTWVNRDHVDHTVTSGSGCACSVGDALPSAERELNSPTLGPGESFAHTFNAAGTYDYVCTIAGHALRGRVVVLVQ